MITATSSTSRMNRRQSGFTLIEVIIASGIALFVFGVGYMAIATTVNASNTSSARIRDTENARLFFNMLQRDLSTAFNGPTNMSKTNVPLNVNANYTPQSAIILNATGTASQQFSDILQFYCRSDHPGALGNSLLFVRYYYDQSVASALCRQAVPYNPGDIYPDQNTQDPSLNPCLLTSDLAGTSAQQYALFDNVTKLIINFQYWDSALRKYFKPGDPGFNSTKPFDSILVTIVFGDARNSQSGVTAASVVNRTYTRVFQLPSSFK